MKISYYITIALVVAFVACEKGTEDNPIILEDMTLSELTLSQFPYQMTDTVFFEDSLGTIIEGLIYRDTLKDQWNNHHVSGGDWYRYRKHSQAIVLILPSIEVTFKLIFENMYWEPYTACAG